MGRRTVWIPDELDALALEQLPAINWSAALQAGVRALLECSHEQLGCTSCGEQVPRHRIVGGPLEDLYRSIMLELGTRVASPGYEGAARIVRRVAIDHGVPGVAAVATPRATRAQHEARQEPPARLPLEADSRRRHPTARPVPTDHPGPRPAEPQEQTA